MDLNTTRTITLVARTDGVDKATAEAKGLANAVGDIPKAADAAGIATEKQAKSLLSLNDAFEKTRRRFVDSVRDQHEYQKVVVQTDKVLQQFPQRQEEVNEVLANARVRFNQVAVAQDNVATSTQRAANMNRFASHEIVNLSRQAQDVVVSLGSGQSLFTVLLQQGTQIVDVLANSTGSIGGLFSQIGAWAGRVFTAGRLAAGGVLAIGTAIGFAAASYSSGQREIERALMGIGRQSGLTVDGINKIAESASSVTGLSIGEATQAATEFAKTGKIYRDNVQAATDVTKNFSIVTGQDTGDAAKTLAKALSGDLVQGFESLNAVLGNMSGKQREAVRDLQIQNRTQEAQAIIIKATADATKNATDALGPLAKAWEEAYNQAAKYWNLVGKGANILTGNISLQEKMNNLIFRASELGANISKEGSSAFPNPVAIAIWRVELEKVNRGMDELLPKLQEAAEKTAKERAEAAGVRADNAVRSVIPQIAQIEKLRSAYVELTKARESAEIMDTRGLGGRDAEAMRAIEVQVLLLEESTREADRHNQKVIEIAGNYRNVGISTALALNAQKDQLRVASAVTGAEQQTAQEISKRNELLLAGKTLIEATAIAAGEHKIAQAQVNASIKQQIVSLEQQDDLIRARMNGTEASVIAEQAYTNAIRQGADAMTARALEAATADNQHQQALQKEQEAIQKQADANAKAAQSEEQRMQAANANVDRQIQALNEELQLLEARRTGSEASVKAEQAFNRALREGADLMHAEALAMATRTAEEIKGNEELNRKRNPNPGGFTDSAMIILNQLIGMEQKFGSGGFDKKTVTIGGIPVTTGTPNDSGLQTYLKTLFDKGMVGGEEWNKTLQQLRDMQAKQKSFDDLIKPVEDLTDSVNNLNDTMNITLDPIYSQGHNAKIGYYEAGGGGGSKGYVTGSPTLPQMTSPPIVPQQQGWTPGLVQPGGGGGIGPIRGTATDPYMQTLGAYATGLTEQGRAAYAEWLKAHPQGLGSRGPVYAATGFSGIVGGTGGTDSQLFQAMVSPGEHINITPSYGRMTPRGDNENATRTTVINNTRNVAFNFNIRGESSDLSRRQTRRQLMESYGRDAAAVA